MSQPPEEARWQTYPTASPGPAAERDPEPAPPLPAPPVWPAEAAQPTAVDLPRPGYSPHDPLHLSAGGGNLAKDGVWTVPPYLSLHGDLGSVRLDFRRAKLASQVIWMQISGGVGSILLIVPQGWAVQLDRVTAGLGSRKVTVADEPTPGYPVLVLTGSLGMGSLKVRHPSQSDERRLRRLLTREQRHAR